MGRGGERGEGGGRASAEPWRGVASQLVRGTAVYNWLERLGAKVIRTKCLKNYMKSLKTDEKH